MPWNLAGKLLQDFVLQVKPCSGTGFVLDTDHCSFDFELLTNGSVRRSSNSQESKKLKKSTSNKAICKTQQKYLVFRNINSHLKIRLFNVKV